MPIPKLFHQTYKSVDNLPPIYRKCQESALKYHPDWTYVFWTDKTMEEEMRAGAPRPLYEAWTALPRMIMKIDVFRYWLMWTYGGVYSDLDYRWLKPFDILDAECVLPISRRQSKLKYPLRFGNSVFASAPGHPFWKLCLDDIVLNPRGAGGGGTTDEEVMDGDYGTGPGFVTRMYHTAPPEIRNTIATPMRFLFHPFASMTAEELADKGSYGVHECASLWIKGAL
jgi:hypothetical protein